MLDVPIMHNQQMPSSTCLVSRPSPLPAAVLAHKVRQPSLSKLIHMRSRSRSRIQSLEPKQQRLSIVATYPEPETEKERSPIDFPQVWISSLSIYVTVLI